LLEHAAVPAVLELEHRGVGDVELRQRLANAPQPDVEVERTLLLGGAAWTWGARGHATQRRRIQARLEHESHRREVSAQPLEPPHLAERARQHGELRPHADAGAPPAHARVAADAVL